MKNITVAVPDDVYREARVRAAEEGRSVSALVTDFLRELSDGEDHFARLEKLQREVLDGLDSFTAGDRLTRDELHDRAIR